jgi:hypothetical protein
MLLTYQENKNKKLILTDNDLENFLKSKKILYI